jgi:hypothetical protein
MVWLRYYVLFTIELATRKVWIGGITTHPDTNWMLLMGRNALDVVDGPLLGKRYLIIDRDTKYCEAFRQMLVRDGIEVIRLPPISPNLKDWVSYCTLFGSLSNQAPRFHAAPAVLFDNRTVFYGLIEAAMAIFAHSSLEDSFAAPCVDG